MPNFMWSLVAAILSRPGVVAWLIQRSLRTPYTNILGPEGDLYMERFWLFNAYPYGSSGERPWWQFPISVRLHRIVRPDGDRHMHDHPWNARTIILSGQYEEIRLERQHGAVGHVDDIEVEYIRRPGDTAKLAFGEYHRIAKVSDGGVWTLFISGKYRGTWGFLVEGFKVPWRRYLQVQKPHDTSREAA